MTTSTILRGLPDFLLSAKRDAKAAKRFLRKVLNAPHTQPPRVITVDKNAAYPPAIDGLKADESLPETTETRQVKYLNNIVEQDHRFIKRRINPGLGFDSFNTARRTLKGYEAMTATNFLCVFGIFAACAHLEKKRLGSF